MFIVNNTANNQIDMSRLNTEFFIAKRISDSKGGGRHNIMVRIATFTVAIGIAVMIVTMSVIGGFKDEIVGKLIGFGAHIQIVNLDGNNSFETSPISRNPLLVDKIKSNIKTKSIDAFAIKGGIVKGKDAIQGVMVKGNELGYDSVFFKSNLLEGRLPRIGSEVRNKDVLISKIISKNSNLSVGDRVEMLFVQPDRAPKRDVFRVCGVYETGFIELDELVMITDIRNVQRLNGWDSTQITGYEITSKVFDELESLDGEVYQLIVDTQQPDGGILMTETILERFQSLFDWLRAHNINAVVMIVVMILVSLFNMISALLIILLERTSMIGILKSLGMNNLSLQRLFVIRSSFIVMKGLLYGNIVGFGLAILQQQTQLVKLDQAGYYLNAIPIKFELWWIVALNLGAFFIIVGVLTLPAMIISMMKPDKTVKFQ